jgi:ubiquinone/menaquinone biosynthesis C-methylase UbiE
MNHQEVGKYWNENAQTWTILARAGYDMYRDHLNTPAFFEILPDVQGLKGLDIGCGEGHNTRLLARRSAQVSAIDISEVFIEQAKEEEARKPLHIDYQIVSAVDLPFADNTFDFATAFMSFMDIPETGKVLSESYRVLKTGGFLQFSIAHPCFDTPHRKNLRDTQGKTYAAEVGDYFTNQHGNISEWSFSSLPQSMRNLPKFRIPRFTRTLSQWLNGLIQAGFIIEYLHEPRPSDEVVKQYPSLQDSQIVAYFLHIRCRKP